MAKQPKQNTARRWGATIGKRGEDAAAEWLQRQGYAILERNWRRPCGELDLIAELADEIIGIEVKTRTSPALGEPEEAITPSKQRKLILTLQTYLMERNDEQRPCRLDVIAVRLAAGGVPAIRHYPSAIASDGGI